MPVDGHLLLQWRIFNHFSQWCSNEVIYPILCWKRSVMTTICTCYSLHAFSTKSTLFFHLPVAVNCPPGTRGAINRTSPACLPCREETYQPNQGQTSCLPCPAGSSSRRKGLENLSSCKGETSLCFCLNWLYLKFRDLISLQESLLSPWKTKENKEQTLMNIRF